MYADEYRPASRKRLVLAAYLDLVLFNTLAALAWRYVAPGQEPPWLKYAVFLGLEAALMLVVRWTPGEWLMSVRQIARAWDAIEPGGKSAAPFLVNARVWKRESFWTAALGVFLIVDGAKEAVRWTMWTPPLPWFGTRLDPEWAMVSGLVSLALGALVLRVHAAAPLAVAGASAATATSVLMSWSLWPEFAQGMVTRRRAFQGLPVRPGEVELMQAALAWGVLAILAAQIVIVVAYRRRFTEKG